jgi:hypothetical protein
MRTAPPPGVAVRKAVPSGMRARSRPIGVGRKVLSRRNLRWSVAKPRARLITRPGALMACNAYAAATGPATDRNSTAGSSVNLAGGPPEPAYRLLRIVQLGQCFTFLATSCRPWRVAFFAFLAFFASSCRPRRSCTDHEPASSTPVSAEAPIRSDWRCEPIRFRRT